MTLGIWFIVSALISVIYELSRIADALEDREKRHERD